MILTTSQLQIIKDAILADPVLNATGPMDTDGAFAIAAALNLPAVPDFIVWQNNVSVASIMGNGFSWTLVDNLGVGKARIWDWMSRLGSINIAQANVRAGIMVAFTGSTGGFPEMRAAIFAHGGRPATVIEKLFATGPGVVSNEAGVGPATMAVEGQITYQQVYDARTLP